MRNFGAPLPATDGGTGNATAAAERVRLGVVDLGRPDGCCRIAVTSSTAIQMLPYDGSTLIINGVQQSIPSAGVSLTTGTLAAFTPYFVYAYMSGSTMALEVSTTGYTQDAAGRMNKTGDATRRLVGKVVSAAANALDTAALATISWFNRKLLRSNTAVTTQTASTSLLLASAISVSAWKGEQIRIDVLGSSSNNGNGNTNVVTAAYNEDTNASSTYNDVGISNSYIAVGNVSYAHATGAVLTATSEGRHAAGVRTYVTGGTETLSIAMIVETWG